MKIPAALSAAFFLSSCMTQVSELEKRSFTLQSPDGEEVTLTAEVADDAEEQTRGLMFRRELQPDTGMIFLYDTAEIRSFWMKNTLIPLDIAYFDDDGVIVHMTTMVPCETDPCEIYPSRQPARYILEMEEGWLEENGVDVGWKILL